ncbi:MAG: class I SAM-dependent methyltransferase [Nitrospiraceae bacterium]|nr:class I SAM-dependent methyltransferase [Nitrospiraceae bacterium]
MSSPYRLNFSKYSVHNIIKENIGENQVALDIGCNEGYLGRFCSSSNVFYGLDYLEGNIDIAAAFYKGAIVYDLNLLEELPWKTRFDVLVFADVLEHVLNPEEVLKFFVNNYLKGNGQVIISLPNIANWRIRIQLLLGRFNYTQTGILDKTHLHFYTFKSARTLIQNCGLRIVACHGGSNFFGPVIKFLPHLKTLLALNLIFIAKNENPF